MASERTAAQFGKLGEIRRDPMAMLPFCGYHMGDYFGHWLKIGGLTSPDKLPKIFYVNWFRRSDEGRWLWPGYGENSRVLNWIIERVAGAGQAVQTAIGWLPATDAIDRTGLDVSAADMEDLLQVDRGEWKCELPSIRQHLESFGDRLPAALWAEFDALQERLNRGER